MTLFDHLDPAPVAPPTEKEKKIAGMAIAADTHSDALKWLRAAIKAKWHELVRTATRDWVSADDARVLLEIGIANGCCDRPRNNQWMGSLFAEKCWSFTGHRIKSVTPGSHSNELKTWTLNAADVPPETNEEPNHDERD